MTVSVFLKSTVAHASACRVEFTRRSSGSPESPRNTRPAMLKSCLALLTISLAGVLPARAAQGDDMLICLPSAPSAQVGSSVELRAWYPSAAGMKPDFRWKLLGRVPAGVLHVDKGSTMWDLKNVNPGAYGAQVDVVSGGGVVASCTLELRVVAELAPVKRATPPSGIRPTSASPDVGRAPMPAPPPPGPPQGGGGVFASGRGFLPSGQREPEGYGLYSYLLLAAPPAPTDKDRYIAIFTEALLLLQPVAALGQTLKPAQLNATWIPVKSAPSGDPDAKWLLDNYDYAAATADLALAGIRGNASGIYIISVRAPLTKGSPSPPILVQDLTHVPATLAATWVNLFINQAAKERFWDTSSFDQLLAKMRLAIALTAEGVPEVKASVATLISFSK